MCKINLNQTQLLPIQENQIGDDLYHTVNARDLHQFLDVGKDFSTWIKDRIERYNLLENQDFRIFPNSGEKSKGFFGRGRPSTEYILTLDAAKDIALMENNAQGQQVRQYFKNFEAKGRKVFTQLRHTIEQKDQTIHQLTQAVLDTNPIYNKIVRYSQLGLNQKEIAKLCDCSDETIRRHQRTLANLGIVDEYKGITSAYQFTDQQLADMAQARLNGATYKQLAIQYGCSRDTLSKKLNAYMQGVQAAREVRHAK